MRSGRRGTSLSRATTRSWSSSPDGSATSLRRTDLRTGVTRLPAPGVPASTAALDRLLTLSTQTPCVRFYNKKRRARSCCDYKVNHKKANKEDRNTRNFRLFVQRRKWNLPAHELQQEPPVHPAKEFASHKVCFAHIYSVNIFHKSISDFVRTFSREI